jgi:hypothetical protein
LKNSIFGMTKNKKGLKRKVVEQSSPDNADKKIITTEIDPSVTAKDDVRKSQKRLRINQSLTSKLHILTNSKEIEIAAPLPGIKTGAKNDNIWNFKVMIPHDKSYRLAGSSPVKPVVENFRHRCVAKSREHLTKLCKEKGIIPPLMAWERWQANSILNQQLHQNDCSSSSSSSGENKIKKSTGSKSNNESSEVTENKNKCKNGDIVDYIIPSDGNYVDDGLIQDLQRGGIEGETAAYKIAFDMSKHAQDLVHEIKALESSCSASVEGAINNSNKKKKEKKPVAIKGERPTVIQHKHTYDISLGEKSKNLLKLNCNYYRKLRELYHLTRSNQSDIDPNTATSNNNKDLEETILNDEDDDMPGGFHACLYTMLAR